MKNASFQKPILISTFLTFFVFLRCSSLPDVKKQAYAKLSNQKIYEYELPQVWKALEETLRDYKVIRREPEEINSQTISKLKFLNLETDWIYSQSRDKYQEYFVHESPRKIYLQTRLKYKLELQKELPGVIVTVHVEEEIERLHSDGSSAGYQKSTDIDSSRAHDLLEKINLSLLKNPTSL